MKGLCGLQDFAGKNPQLGVGATFIISRHTASASKCLSRSRLVTGWTSANLETNLKLQDLRNKTIEQQQKPWEFREKELTLSTK